MKHLAFIVVTVVLALSVDAQVKQEVIASAGGYNTAPGLSISWTLGETLIPSFTSQDGSLTLTHGFQQMLIVTIIQENIDVPVNVKIYPNPAGEFVRLLFEAPVDREITITLLDSQGRLVITDVIEDTMIEKTLNLQFLAGGIYYLRLSKGKLINVYKVVKL